MKKKYQSKTMHENNLVKANKICLLSCYVIALSIYIRSLSSTKTQTDTFTYKQTEKTEKKIFIIPIKCLSYEYVLILHDMYFLCNKYCGVVILKQYKANHLLYK